MSTSKTTNNKLAVKLATDKNYKLLANGTVKKRGSDGKYRTVGTERHGYNVVTYKGKKIVTARAYAAKTLLSLGHNQASAVSVLGQEIVVRKNGVSTDDRTKNLKITYPSFVKRTGTKALTRKRIDRMLELFFDGFSVAKIARRFRRKISRSHVSKIIRKELGVSTITELE